MSLGFKMSTSSVECPKDLDKLIEQVANHPFYHSLPEETQWGFSMGVVLNRAHLHKSKHQEDVEYAKNVWNKLYNSNAH